MKPGDVVAGRFLVERLAGKGGMGSVYRAFDRSAGVPVALKVVETGTQLFEDRFHREAKALAAIAHPAVVRYVGQGMGPSCLWLAMEWLEGEDLATRLDRGRVAVEDALALSARAADAIGAAHAAGIVHRDLKPTNLFLVGGDPRALKVLDFGIARVAAPARPLTKTGQMVGTVGFMAPEQITGERDLDHRADIFALGCVMFEAITGRPAFGGPTVIAIIAKVLREEPAIPSSLEPAIVPALDALLLEMLAKDRNDRTGSAEEVASRVREIASALETNRTSVLAPPSRASVTVREQRLVSVILVAPDDPTATTSAEERRFAEAHAADVLDLGDGARMFVISGAGSAKDQAARAATFALALRSKLEHARIALATGLAEPKEGLPVGPAIDRAAVLLEQAATASEADLIPIDDVTRALLDDSFEIESHDGAHALVGRALAQAAPAAVRATPFVGREKELAIIDAVLAETLSEPVPRAVLVTGQAGAGKSRLRREFLSRLSRQHGDEPHVVLARAEVVGSGSGLGLARQIVLHLAHASDNDARDVKAAKLSHHLDALAERSAIETTEPAPGGFDVARMREFLGELIGADPSEPPSVALQTARNEPRGFAEWMRRMFADLLAEEARREPLIVVLEDLHWGDQASVDFIGEAMRTASDLPLFVFAVARNEVWDVLPRLREALSPHEVRLSGLTPRASQRLAEAALGRAASPETIARIVARSAGNPFFVEELARCEASGQTDTSETVLAVVQARIERLDPEARRVLRAASVFGRAFVRDGVAALIGRSGTELELLLEYLATHELIERERAGEVDDRALTIPGPHALASGGFAFSHDIVRDAAYATFPEADRREAHLLAAEWLAQKGGEDPAILAEHYEHGHANDPAARWLARAIDQELNAASYERVIALASRALSLEPSGALRGAIRAAEGLARAWRQEWRSAMEATGEALELLPKGSTLWFRAAAVHTFASISIGDRRATAELTRSLLEVEHGEPIGPYGFALFAVTMVLILAGERETASALLARFATHDDSPLTDFGFAAWGALSRGFAALLLDDDPAKALHYQEISSQLAPGIADSVARVVIEYFRAAVLYDCGDLESAFRNAQRVLVSKSAQAVPYLRMWSLHVSGRVYLMERRYDEALAVADSLQSRDDELMMQRSRSLRAQIQLAMGALDQAALTVREVESGTFAPQDIAAALAVAARISVLRSEPLLAVQYADRAVDLAVRMGCSSSTLSMILLAQAEAIESTGDIAAATEALGLAVRRIERIAEGLRDPRLKGLWLASQENAKTRALLVALTP